MNTVNAKERNKGLCWGQQKIIQKLFCAAPLCGICLFVSMPPSSWSLACMYCFVCCFVFYIFPPILIKHSFSSRSCRCLFRVFFTLSFFWALWVLLNANDVWPLSCICLEGTFARKNPGHSCNIYRKSVAMPLACTCCVVFSWFLF